VDSITLYEKRDELHRVLQSRHFAKAKKKSRFLEFICEQAFLGNAEKLNEYLIGVEVYGRGPDFDPQQDPIVRVQAHEIRRALRQFYEEEGKDSAYRLDLPPGHYVPIFKKAEIEPARSAPEAADRASPWRRLAHRQALSFGLALLCLVLGVLLVRERMSRQQGRAFKAAEPALPQGLLWFWKPFLPPAAPPLIVIPNHPLLRAAHDGDSKETWRRGHLIPKERIPEFRDTIHYRELRGFYFVPSETDFTAVGEALGLVDFFELFARAGQRFRVKASRLVDFEEIRRSNAILLGGNQPWSGRVFLNPEGFWFHAGVISNPHPRSGEETVYRPEFDPLTNRLIRDYALVLMLPNENRGERILLIYGIYTQGSQAAIEYVTNAERLQELRKALLELSPDRRAAPEYFQLLLTTTVENSVPGKASLVAARVIPG
jgi:hypothetical protein